MELLVVIGIIALLISVLLPSLQKARNSAKQLACLSNLRQIGSAMAIYQAEWKGVVSVADFNQKGSWGSHVSGWDNGLKPYLFPNSSYSNVLKCPFDVTRDQWNTENYNSYRVIMPLVKVGTGFQWAQGA